VKLGLSSRQQLAPLAGDHLDLSVESSGKQLPRVDRTAAMFFLLSSTNVRVLWRRPYEGWLGLGDVCGVRV
jgi:hypothetical protein